MMKGFFVDETIICIGYKNPKGSNDYSKNWNGKNTTPSG